MLKYPSIKDFISFAVSVLIRFTLFRVLNLNELEDMYSVALLIRLFLIIINSSL